MRSTTREHDAAPKGPWFVPALLVELALLVIPGGTRRTRYEQEFEAELYGMPAGRQATHALGILAFALALRRATAKPHPHERRSMVTVLKGKPSCAFSICATTGTRSEQRTGSPTSAAESAARTSVSSRCSIPTGPGASATGDDASLTG